MKKRDDKKYKLFMALFLILSILSIFVVFDQFFGIFDYIIKSNDGRSPMEKIQIKRIANEFFENAEFKKLKSGNGYQYNAEKIKTGNNIPFRAN